MLIAYNTMPDSLNTNTNIKTNKIAFEEAFSKAIDKDTGMVSGPASPMVIRGTHRVPSSLIRLRFLINPGFNTLDTY